MEIGRDFLVAVTLCIIISTSCCGWFWSWEWCRVLFNYDHAVPLVAIMANTRLFKRAITLSWR
jgi:hypothetical protein